MWQSLHWTKITIFSGFGSGFCLEIYPTAPPFHSLRLPFEALFDDHRKKSPLSEMCFCLLKNRRETIFSKTIFEIQIIPSFLFKEKDVQ